MNRFLEWWKMPGRFPAESDRVSEKGGNPGQTGEKRYVTLVKSLLLALLPLLCCVVHCAAQGRGLGEVYAPSSEWNDELFYFKQVESILQYGYPQGYFGFNESHALKLSFAAWSPVLVFPWILWGLVFGWNLMSPILCNIFLMSLCCFLFVWLVRPTWKQMGVVTLLFCLYTPFVRFMLSLMAEVICFAMVILFYLLAINYLKREKDYKLVILFFFSGLMTLMRPYLVLAMLLPIYLWIRRGKSRGAKWVHGFMGLAVLGAVLGIYVCINHYLGAEYFTPLFSTDWITAFFEEGLFGGIYFTLRKIYYVGQDFLRHIQNAFRSGLASGGYFVGSLVCMGVLALQGFRDWRRFRRLQAAEAEGFSADRKDKETGKKAGLVTTGRNPEMGAAERKQESEATGQARRVWGKMVVELHLAFSFLAMFFALLLMYKLTEGSRHLLTFLGAAVFVIGLMDTKFYKKAVLVGVTFAYFYTYMATEPFDFEIPFQQEERVAAVETWQEVLEERLALVEEKVPNYDNVVIWVFSDQVEETPVRTSYQLLYGLPKGFGISCCMREYVIPNIDVLKSRYIAIPTGGEIDLLCRERGWNLVYGDAEMVLYERY